jgi:hypothetical protein
VTPPGIARYNPRAMFRLALLALVIAGGVARAQPSPQPPESRPERGMLAVLRRDGILLPFAAFKGNGWSQPWPYPTFPLEVPVTVAAVPDGWWGGVPYLEWSAVLPSGSAVSLQLKAPTVIPVCEDRRIGIRTDYKSTEPLAGMLVQPYPKDALAVTPGVRVDPIEIVTASSPERAAFALALAGKIAEAEEDTIRGLRGRARFRHPIDAAVRRSTVAQLEAWYRAPMDAHGWTLSWIEAAKRYPPGPDDEGCGLETVISGWVQQNVMEKTPRAELTARVTYCDREGATYMLPFGLVRTRGRLHWVYQLSGAGQEWYQVTQVSPGRLRPVVEYFGGGGERCRP